MKRMIAVLLTTCLSASAPASADKLPTPEFVDVAKAKIAIQEAFGPEIEKAKTSAAKRALAAKMLVVANDAQETAGNRWLLFERARDLAVGAADLALVVQTLDDQEKAFVFNRLEATAEACEKLGKATPALGKPLVDFSLPAAESAIEQDQFQLAVRLLSVASSAAKSAKKDLVAGRKIETRLRIAKELAKLIESAKEDDELMGKLRCFYQGAWERGLPLLVKSKDEVLAALAKRDLASPKEPKEQCELGDAWFELAQNAKGEERLGMLGRASSWYHKGVAGVGGLAKVKVEARLKKLADEVDPLEIKEPKGAAFGDEITSKTLPSMKLKLIRAKDKSFKMGSSAQEQAAVVKHYYEGKPQMWMENEKEREVKLKADFLLGVHPVTQAEFEKVMKRNPSHFQNDKGGGPDHPVEKVSWFDALEFCNELSKLDGRTPYYQLSEIKRADKSITSAAVKNLEGKTGYRLPTEPEWEYACRAGARSRFFFGDDDAKLGEYAWYASNSKNSTHPVESKLPNGWGLYDMVGNVWQWCDTSASAGSRRVLRGGSWYDDPRFCRTAHRHDNQPDSRDFNVGFRISAPAR